MALRRLDSIIHLLPECASTWDAIMVVGLIGPRRAIVYLNWSANGLRASEPQFIS